MSNPDHVFPYALPAPLSRVDVFAQGLPGALNGFIGRERDVTELRRLLKTAPLLTLTGAGGIGKTRLAVQVARQAAPEFADGTLLIDFSGAASREHLVAALASALGVFEEIGRSLWERVLDSLRTKDALLVLDTCERLTGEVADICRLVLAYCPHLRVIATSREPLRIAAETLWQVPPLSLPPRGEPDPWRSELRAVPEELLRYEALRLFTARAQQVRPDFGVTADNVRTIAEICHRLDGVALAVELAATRVRVLSAEQILTRLDDRFRLLTTSERDVPPRQRALRATVEWSHEQLSEPERALLRRLAVFAGWRTPTAERVCVDGTLITAGMLPDLHDSLLNKSLILLDSEHAGTTYYRMLDPIRHYAAQRLTESGDEEGCRRRFHEHIADRAEQTAALFRGELPWAERMAVVRLTDHSQEAIRQGLAWSLRRGDAHVGLRTCSALRVYWSMRGLFAEGSAWLRDFLAISHREDVPARVRGSALAHYAELALDVDGYTAAREAALEGLRLARTANDEQAIATAFTVLANLALRPPDIAAGQRYGAAALAACRTSGDRLTEGFVLGILALLAHRDGRRQDAVDLLERALVNAQSIGDEWGVARCRVGMGTVALRSGKPATAATYFERALEVFEEVGTPSEIARVLAGLGRCATLNGDHATARRHLSRGLQLSVRSGQRLAVARALEAMADLDAAQSHPERVAVLAAAAQGIRAELGHTAEHPARLRRYAQARLSEPAEAWAWRQGARLTVEAAVSAALAPSAVQASAPGPAAAEGPGLTPREQEIAQLVGEGLSNRQVAERLTISRATAARHVANIFGKLGVSSRTRLAGWGGDETSGGNGAQGQWHRDG